MSKTLSIIDTGELIDLIGQCVLPPVVQAQAILDERKKILGEAKRGSEKHRRAKRTPITPKRWKTPNALSRT